MLHKVRSGGVWTASSLGRSGGTWEIFPTGDTLLDSQATTTNYDSELWLGLGASWGTASFTRFPVLEFSLSSLPTALTSVTKAELVLQTLNQTDEGVWTGGSTAVVAEAREMLRAFVASQATWTVYSTGNNWTTAGARGVGTDIGSTIYGGGATVGSGILDDSEREIRIDITSLVSTKVAADATVLRLIVGTTTGTQSSNIIYLGSVNHSTVAKRPRLRIIA